MRISDWSSDVCSSDLEHLEIIDNAWHHRLDAGLIGRLLEFEADAQLQEARLASPAAEADQHLVEIVVIVRRSEEHTSELQSLMRLSYAVFCLKKTKARNITTTSSVTPTPMICPPRPLSH